MGYQPTSSSAASSNFLSRPSFTSSRSHEEAYNTVKSPQSSRYESSKLGSYSETSSPRDYSGGHRKYSIETLDSGGGREYHYTPKGTRKFREPLDGGGNQPSSSGQKYSDARFDSQGSHLEHRRESGSGSAGSRKYPALPVPDPSVRGREHSRDGRNFIPSSWKSSFSSWTLSSPLNLRKFRTSSSDRTSTFERSRRLQPGYRSLNERDKQYYSCSGKSSENL